MRVIDGGYAGLFQIFRGKHEAGKAGRGLPALGDAWRRNQGMMMSRGKSVTVRAPVSVTSSTSE
jgi:hypothetical protein